MKKLLSSLVLLALLFPSSRRVLASDAGPQTPDPAVAGQPEPELSRIPRWQQLFPPVSPSARVSHVMAYDPARHVGVLFGGFGEGGVAGALEDTWEWDSQTMTWVERLPAHRPPPRFGHSMAYDKARGVTVLFGGVDAGAQEYNDTWLWDGSDWTQVFPANAPSLRWLHGMVYDSRRQRAVLFGGLEGGTVFGDTWEWDGTNWIVQDITNPTGGYGSGMAYDPRRGVTVLFGGDDAVGFHSYYDHTWERVGGGDWVKMRVQTRPPARLRMAVTYFPPFRRVFIFGGLGEEKYLDDTWFWNGQRWGTSTFDPQPSGRCCTAMVYDPILKGLLLFGGSVSSIRANDTWLFRSSLS